MNTREIEALIEKYYRGETSLEEEKSLRSALRGLEQTDPLARHAGLFRYFEMASHEKIMDPDFERKFEERITGSSETPVIPMYKSRKRLYSLLAMAATLIILAGLIFTIHEFGIRQQAAVAENPELAYEQATQALLMVSAGLNQGLDKIQPLVKFQKGMGEIDKLSRFSKYQPLIINQDIK